MSRILSKASRRLVEAVEGSTVLTRTMVASERVIEDHLTEADAVILTRSEMRLLLERYTQQLLTEQSRIIDEHSED